MKNYRILKYPWHTAHDYELAKLPHSFYYLSSTYRRWSHQHRPLPSKITWISDQAEQETDLMILHLDQWTYYQPAKRFLFLNYKNTYPGPKIVINHGCNLKDGCSSETLQELVSGCHMVCNSSFAQQLWNVPNSTFIRHGMSPEEWPSTNYELNNTVAVQASSEFYRIYNNHAAIEAAEKIVPITWVGRDIVCRSFSEYKAFLQKSSVFFQPSLASPNPRARTEAMLSGLAVVSTNMHGEEEYIEHGVNGFISNDPEELCDFLRFLNEHPEQAKEIGQAGRVTAQRIFHIDNFKQEWNQLLEECLN